MKVHTTLKELLEDFTLKMAEPWQDELDKHDFDFIEKYASSNSLSSVEPEPLAKNKDSESRVFKICPKCGGSTTSTCHQIECLGVKYPT